MGAYNDDVLLIHIPKCAGWSIKTYMRDHLPGVLMPDPKVSGSTEKSRLPIGHVRLQDIPRFTGRPVESFKLIIAPIRHPAAQQVSQATFWATRYLKGSRHVHDVNTWRHVSEAIVQEDIMRCALTDEAFEWQPRHINMAGFVADERCDFHVWYEQHYGYEPGQSYQDQIKKRITDAPAAEGANCYQDFGGYYRYWVTYNGEIPDTVRLVPVAHIDEDLPRLLRPYAHGRDLPEPSWLNTSPHQVAEYDWIPKAARPILERKFSWYFAEGQNLLWQPE